MAGMKTLMIIGGGAAGLAAAVEAGRALRAAGAQGAVRVVLLEADERVGRSILATGNGRCNFSNAQVDAGIYRNAAFVGEALAALAGEGTGAGAGGPMRGGTADAVRPETADAAAGSPPDPVHELFADLGLVWREESEGRLYPLANKATSVLDVLRSAAHDAGVVVERECRAVRIDAPQHVGDRFHIRCADGAVRHADAVIVAVGGRAIEALELPVGLACAPGHPVLGPLRTDSRVTRQLNNIRVRCAAMLVRPAETSLAGEGRGDEAHVLGGERADAKRVDRAGRDGRRTGNDASRCDGSDACRRSADGTLSSAAEIARERGEVLFRDYGVSGIAIFNLSRFAREGDVVLIDLLPDVPAERAVAFLRDRRARLCAGGRTFTREAFLSGMVLEQVARVVLREAGLRPEAPLAKADLPAIARALKALPFAVQGVGDAKQCQVTRGGLDVRAFDSRTMGARSLPRLYAAGEALDVDAPCGGYNLHWAWASGMVAARAAVRALLAEAPAGESLCREAQEDVRARSDDWASGGRRERRGGRAQDDRRNRKGSRRA